MLVRRETIEKEQFEKLLAGEPEADIFGPDEPGVPELPAGRMPLPERARPEVPRPLPRPGLAAEMHGDDPPAPGLA